MNNKSKRALVSSIAAGKLFNNSALWKNVRQSMKKGSTAYEKMANIVSPHPEKIIVKPVPDTLRVPSSRKSLHHGGDIPSEHLNLGNLSNQLFSDIPKEDPNPPVNLAETLENLQDFQHAQALSKEQGDSK